MKSNGVLKGNKIIMKGKVERFITRKGFEYKSDITTSIIKANYTFGLRLRKIYTTGYKDTYTLKQEDFKKIFFNIIYNKFNTVRDRPIYTLYKNNIKIGCTEYCKIDTIPIETAEFNLRLVETHDKKNHIIKVMKDENVIAEITKSRLRYGKKNIYDIYYDRWTYDKDFLILIVAFCDVVFFPEWRLLSWSYMEYDLN